MKRAIGYPARKGTPRPRGQEGVGLVEVLVAMAIVGTAMVALLTGLSTGSLALTGTDGRATAGSLARSQMEYAKSQEYRVAPSSYDLLTPLPSGYSISAVASALPGRDSNIQKITVTVSCQGETLLVLEDFKTNR